MLDYFKDRSFDRGNFKELVGIAKFALGFVAYIVFPIIFISLNLEWLAALILVGVPAALTFLAIFEICFPKDEEKVSKREKIEENA